jgi:hypothetical protein
MHMFWLSRSSAMTEASREQEATPAPANNPPPAPAPRERPTPEGDGLDPTRYGDWEKNGRCIDF